MSKSIHTPLSKRLCHLLARYRKTAGLTQTELATAIHRPQSFVSKVELGERRIDVIELIELLSALRADPVAFIAALTRKRA
jgi:transcriptional regulator with XRE-family HTH domain